MENTYMDEEFTKKLVAQGQHRQFIGGKWDEIGRLQFEYLKSKGLKPKHRLLDVGCGSLRGGVHFVPYLKAKHYYGFDLNMSLIKAGLNIEISNLGLCHKVDLENFSTATDFQYPQHWPSMDMALALSLLTHLNYNSICTCLKNTCQILKKGGRFYATIFEVSEEDAENAVFQCDEVTTYPRQDPFHYTRSRIEQAAESSGLMLIDIEEFEHPRKQKMAIFERK